MSPEASPNHSRGAQPGRYQRPRPLRPRAAYSPRLERVDVPTDLDLSWAPDGAIYLDEDLSQWSGWAICRVVDPDDEDDD